MGTEWCIQNYPAHVVSTICALSRFKPGYPGKKVSFLSEKIHPSATGLIIFAKAPIPGEVKTRLSHKYGSTGAAIIYRQMVEQLLWQVSRIGNIQVYLFCSPGTKHPFFHQCRRRYGVVLKKQVGSNLGERMFNAIRFTNRKHENTILIGSDVPELDWKIVGDLLRARPVKNNVVMIPANDGGYVLVSMTGNHPCVFRNIPWGTNRVMQKSRVRIRQCGLIGVELGICQDVDTPSDIYRLKRKGMLKGYP